MKIHIVNNMYFPNGRRKRRNDNQTRKIAAMSIRPIDSTYHISGQVSPKDIGKLAEAGYTAVVCMRPDGEGFFQPSFADIEKAAQAAGISAYYLPVGGAAMPMEQAKKLRGIVKDAKGPILAYCASGARSTMLYQMAMQMGG